MQPSSSRISELSSIIAKETAIVDGFFSSTNLPALSFEQDGPVKVPIPAHETDVLAAQEKVIASTQELHDLMKGPTEMLMGISVRPKFWSPAKQLTSSYARSSIPTTPSVFRPCITMMSPPTSPSTEPHPCPNYRTPAASTRSIYAAY